MSTSVEETVGVDLLGQLGYQEVPEKVWVWRLTDGLCAGSSQHWVYISESPKGILERVRIVASRFPKTTQGTSLMTGWPEAFSYPEDFPAERWNGVILYDDNGQELCRWEVSGA